MENSDICLLVILELGIISSVLYAACKDVYIYFKESRSGIFGVARRGESSMSIIYAGYGASMASFLALVTNAEGVSGHRVALLIVPFISLTYLFFFSSWFRNSVLFRITGRIKND